MKKFLKGLAGVAIIGGIAAGVYYLLTGDKYTDFDDFDEESNDDLQDFLDNEKKDDHYVSLDLTKEKATEDDKIIGEVKEDGDKVVKADSDQSGEVEGFSFSDLTD
ncbi:MAG: hypothetical protein IJV16_01405 [Lachnospiraceae bacterium]|nr:hypothetical protein [Lachnospiraceae bacterium]MBR1524602.1 hypothetical protein [Lachnospiraceae bacterium]